MRRLLFSTLFIGCLALVAVMVQKSAFAEKEEQETEERISLKRLPIPIKRALKDIKVGQISEIEREKTSSGMVYEVELRVGKHEVELVLAPDGKLLSVEIEAEDDDDEDDE